MFSNQIKVKDHKANFSILYPEGNEEEKETIRNCFNYSDVTVCCSIDIGIKNFAIRIENKTKKEADVVLFEKISFMNQKEGGTSEINRNVISMMGDYLNERWSFIKKCNFIVIERQLAVNYKSSCIMMILLGFLLSRVDYMSKNLVITSICPKLKSKLFSDKRMDKREVKMWSIEKAKKILKQRSDDWSIDVINHHQGKSKTKADDLADTVVQLAAVYKFCIV